MSPEPQSQQHGHYTCIRIREKDSFEKLYSLILDYIHEPELALSVNKLVFRSTPPSHQFALRNTDQLRDLRAGNHVQDILEEPAISKLVDDLDLEGPEKLDWIRTLTWMKPEVVAARNAETSSDYRHSLNNNKRDKIFAHYAAAALLMLCPNIETLKYEQGSRVIEKMLRRNNYGLLPTRHLQKLRHVTILPTNETIIGDERFYVPLAILTELRLFHRLPALESLHTDAVGPDEGGDLDHFPPATSNLKRIHVTHSSYGSDDIGALIRVSRQLEEFTFTTGGRCNLDGGWELRHANTIGKALLEHKSSLRKIDIDIDEYISETDLADDESSVDESHEDEWYRKDKEISTGPLKTTQLRSTREYRGTIGSMHDFEALTHLSIGVGLLLGCPNGRRELREAPFRLIDALPKSLEYLLFRGYERGAEALYDSQIDEFLLLKEVRLPSLREVYGIDETIPIAVSVDAPDDNEDELWVIDESEDESAEMFS